MRQSADHALVRRSWAGGSGYRSVPSGVAEALQAPGQPLGNETRVLMESRFGHDFSRVRIHNDAQAEKSAGAIDALAYTVGEHIAFAPGRYQPETAVGRQLIAHELSHVVQQVFLPGNPSRWPLSLPSARDPAEGEARRIGADIGTGIRTPPRVSSAPAVQRADPQAVHLTTHLGRTRRTGVQFWPRDVTDTQVGPVSVEGGLVSTTTSRLHVIIGANQTINALAAELLPLWLTATPFTPLGAVAPLPLVAITQDDLARALIVYNQTFLAVPAMTTWRSGLRLPLPVEIDGTGAATLHPLQIQSLAAGFDPAWAPLLTRPAPATVAPPAATVAADVTAWLAAQPTPLARGTDLAVRVQTNATASRPFVREAFLQLGVASFDVALAFMDSLVQAELQRLDVQTDGRSSVNLVRAAIAAAPAVRTPAQQASLDRANTMFAALAGGPPVAPPTPTHARPEKSVTVDTVKLDGSTHNPATDLAVANAIFAQCNVRLSPGVQATATAPQTLAWLGGNTNLRSSNNPGAPSVEERNLGVTATAVLGLGGRIRAFFVATVTGRLPGSRGYSFPPFSGPAASVRDMVVVRNSGTEKTLAHEIGHVLINTGHPGVAGQTLMDPTGVAPLGEAITNPDCATLYANA